MKQSFLKRWFRRYKHRRAYASAIIDPDVLLKSNFKLVNIGPKDNVKIGRNCRLHCKIFCMGRLSIGERSYIGHSMIWVKEKVEIGRYAIISDNVVISDNNNHPVSMKKRMDMSMASDFNGPLWSWSDAASKPIVIEDNVWIGRGAVIMKGVRIGKGSVVGINSVVTADVPPACVVGGNPARVLKYLDD